MGGWILGREWLALVELEMRACQLTETNVPQQTRFNFTSSKQETIAQIEKKFLFQCVRKKRRGFLGIEDEN